jgi:hypothetical protein
VIQTLTAIVPASNTGKLSAHCVWVYTLQGTVRSAKRPVADLRLIPQALAAPAALSPKCRLLVPLTSNRQSTTLRRRIGLIIRLFAIIQECQRGSGGYIICCGAFSNLLNLLTATHQSQRLSRHEPTKHAGSTEPRRRQGPRNLPRGSEAHRQRRWAS